ncbi:MAG TPA: ATP-binding protein [Solirubrobacteraceae bacterium]|nr:ATP-binding protein [Solirubrobacteraceae bacterium]
MAATRDLNPFRFSGPLPPEQMIDRDDEADDLLALADGGHSFRLVGPRRYGKTTLLRRVLESAERQGTATVLVDLQDVLSIAEIVVRIERGYQRLKGPLRRHVENLFRSWNIGVSLGGGGFTATLQRNPNVDAESVLLRLLELPAALFERQGTPSLVVFDEIQDVLAVGGADGKIRSVIQHQTDAATYGFAGSAPGVMQQLFADPKRPLLDQAVPRNLAPLPLDAVGAYVTDRFGTTKRAPGSALEPLLEFTRGHPQRSMMLAHYLWERTPRGTTADEGTWVSALDRAAGDSAPLMRAIWRALTANERRVARALAVSTAPLHSEETATAVGIKRSSIGKALESLLANADAIAEGGKPRLTDPMFEYWLQTRGLTPAAGEDDDPFAPAGRGRRA